MTKKPEPVTIKITRFGDGKVSSGRHIADQGDEMLAEGETIKVAPDLAAELEERGLVEIQ